MFIAHKCKINIYTHQVTECLWMQEQRSIAQYVHARVKVNLHYGVIVLSVGVPGVKSQDPTNQHRH